MAFPRISLAEVLVAAAVFCGILAGLRFAGALVAQIAVLLAGALFLYALSAAIFDRGSARAAATGFAIGAGLYGVLFVAAGVRQETDLLGHQAYQGFDELNISTHTLPTTDLLKPLYYVVAETQWEQTDTGETMTITRDAAGTLYDPSGRVFDPHSPQVPRTWRRGETFPAEKDFLAVGQVAWAALFGYVTSIFARIAYVRGTRVRATAEANDADRA